MLPLSLVFVLFLSCPSFTRAGGSYNDDLRMLDLELEMLSLKSQMLSQERAAIGARLHEATREREQFYKDAGRDIELQAVSPVLELDHITVLDPEPLFPTMRPPWLQPADRWPRCPRNSGRGCGVRPLMIAGSIHCLN
jgi:hypothetical protein